MKIVAYIDTETNPKENRILDMGGFRTDGRAFHSNNTAELKEFLNNAQFICGHNIIHHDLNYLRKSGLGDTVDALPAIDTLYLSPLLFPSRPYHALLKDDKLQTDELNNPLNDAKKARDLFEEEVAAFHHSPQLLQEIYCSLLAADIHFAAFFLYVDRARTHAPVERAIRTFFQDRICQQADLGRMIQAHPVELAYCLALINASDRDSITPPWVLKNFTEVERLMTLLRNRPCINGCNYCAQALDVHVGLKQHFDFDRFRTYGDEPLQERAAQAAVLGRSLLAIFPTGGGKSVTFQLPALMAGANSRGLTIVISPLQSLMKDQVDNLEKIGIHSAVTINGLLDPIERAKSFERVQDGAASILYISPESLRSRSIERLILGRKIERFVIDEAHCLSSWGQDFRVDYLYIGDFIRSLQKQKNLQEPIPVSCFTATAKQKVIEDICQYFQDKLHLDMEVFSAETSRTNLTYRVIEKESAGDKYAALRQLIQEKDCPTIIYVSRTRMAYTLAEKLTKDGHTAKPYHGKMNKNEKSANQDDFIAGDVSIMVATSAFGMGVDKKDVKRVIHYDISDSLENYVQEAGRAGRDESITAECYVLYNEEDLSKHFILLNQTKITIKEINQVWRAIKYLTKFRNSVSNSALEIARKAGWDDNIKEIETRVTSAVSALEQAGYLERGQNMPRIFATSILSKNAQEAIDKIHASELFGDNQKEMAVRIIKKLLSQKSRKHANEESGESRIDYISDHLGITKQDVIRIVNLLREAKILADHKDMTAFIVTKESKGKSLQVLKAHALLEKHLLKEIDEEARTFHMKAWNESALERGCPDASPQKIKTILNFWAIKKWVKRTQKVRIKQTFQIRGLLPKTELQEKCIRRHNIAQYILDYFHERVPKTPADKDPEEVLIEFSIQDLLETYVRSQLLFDENITIDDIEDALFYLSRIEALKIEGGFLVLYNAISVKRLETDNKIQYKVEDYKKLAQFYESKIQQIHIVGEYAKRMVTDYKDALQFVDDYFRLNYNSFLSKYFPGSRRDEIRQNITPAKFKQLFGELSPRQLGIIKDKDSKYMVVAAGPGSGKTRILVHKLASLLLLEDVKYEQLLMLTFSRAAATEFKSRLVKLIGNAAHFVEINTFHAYCFNLLGRVGNKEKSDNIVEQAVTYIQQGEAEPGRITKTVMVIDEAQDMNAHEYALLQALIAQNDDMRVIAVGDDDQNIYAFRGSSAKHLSDFAKRPDTTRTELTENYRSRSNLVDFANQFVQTISGRLKSTPGTAIQTNSGEITITQHVRGDLISPLLENIRASALQGTVAVLTYSNEDAGLIAGCLTKMGLPARLIQTNDDFNLHNLCEIRYLIAQIVFSDKVKQIPDDIWEAGKRRLKQRYGNSSKYDLIARILTDFELANPKYKYLSDLEMFLQESKLEDFYNASSATILVSTMHKAKGKEFDNVFILLRNYSLETDENKRLLYMAITRAKSGLYIHTDQNSLEFIKTADFTYRHSTAAPSPPDEIHMALGHEYVYLSYFENVQHRMKDLQTGDILIDHGDGYGVPSGPVFLKFSKSFIAKCEELQQKGFGLHEVKIGFLLYWKGQEMEEEIKIVLPEVVFRR